MASGTDGVSEVLGTLLRFELKDDAAVRGFDALADKLIAAVRAAEPETLVYVFHTVEDAPLSRVVYEVFANQMRQNGTGRPTTSTGRWSNLTSTRRVLGSKRLGAPHSKLLADTLGTT
ncbi:MAG TPA: hypothetical protein VFU98_14870 [Microlunatus sp.]|nr:hypothetical protein [Microlunatus sp.]